MKSLEELKKIRDKAKREMEMRDDNGSYRIVVGMGTCGIASGAREVLSALVKANDLQNKVKVLISQVGCTGDCSNEPVVVVTDTKGKKTTYAKVTPFDAKRIIDEHVLQDKIVGDILLHEEC